jgi:integrase
MRGSIRQRGKKSWQIQIYTGSGPDGKPRRHFETIRGRKGDAQRRLIELLSSLDKGIYPPHGRITVAEHLRNWLESYVKNNCSPRTYDGYQAIIEHHLIPNLGHGQLKHLDHYMIERYYNKAREIPLSPRTVHHQHRVLSEALKYACRHGILARNPCELVDIKGSIKQIKRRMRTLTPAEAATLLQMAQANQYYPVIYTAISSGLRQAELLGLRWRDIDLDSKSISVCQTLYKRHGVCEFREPKTSRSKRRIGMTGNLANYLAEYKGERESLSLHLGRLLKLDDLVFSNAEGEPIDPGVLSHNFARLAKRAGLKNVRFHDLRHTFTSFMLLCGVNPKVISETLGHASVAFTLDTYGHIIAGMQPEAMALLDEVLPPGKNASEK